jgi:hypothetical protein
MPNAFGRRGWLEAAVLEPQRHGDVPQLTCHNGENLVVFATANFIGSQSIDAMVLLWLMARWSLGLFSGGCFGYGEEERHAKFVLCASLVRSVTILCVGIMLYSICL